MRNKTHLGWGHLDITIGSDPVSDEMTLTIVGPKADQEVTIRMNATRAALLVAALRDHSSRLPRQDD